jgi:hypothetical protein
MALAAPVLIMTLEKMCGRNFLELWSTRPSPRRDIQRKTSLTFCGVTKARTGEATMAKMSSHGQRHPDAWHLMQIFRAKLDHGLQQRLTKLEACQRENMIVRCTV